MAKLIKIEQGNWEAVTTKGKILKSVKRLSDGEIFSLGDYVTNGARMRGRIESFETDENVQNRMKGSPVELYVQTDWSGVGMNLDSVMQITNMRVDAPALRAAVDYLKPDTIKLPSKFQPLDFCGLKLGKKEIIGAQVTKVSFTSGGKVLYDLEIGVGSEMVTRLHSIDSEFVVELGKKKK